ncbi:MAG: YhbY family RNA-binding protein [Opitutales bacterium]|nr:YhbY family RNA-binding protein [Opitutales bacterium]
MNSENRFPFETLTGAEKKKLRGLAQTIEAKIQIGRETALGEIVKQLELVFKHEDLVKVRFHIQDRKAVMALCAEIEEAAAAFCVSQVGKTAAFFKPHTEQA